MANQNNNKGGQQQDVNQLLKVRREKLQNLQEAGKDPFQITKYNVTHHSSDVKELYNAHEAEILGDRKAPDVEGLDDAAKREVINNDYNERREIMDAKPIEVNTCVFLDCVYHCHSCEWLSKVNLHAVV